MKLAKLGYLAQITQIQSERKHPFHFLPCWKRNLFAIPLCSFQQQLLYLVFSSFNYTNNCAKSHFYLFMPPEALTDKQLYIKHQSSVCVHRHIEYEYVFYEARTGFLVHILIITEILYSSSLLINISVTEIIFKSQYQWQGFDFILLFCLY